MPTPKLKKRNAWLITWEGMPYALEDLGRPRVVAILKSHISETTVEKILPVLFISESSLTFSEKIGIAFATHRPSWLRRDFNGRISCGDHPHLWARRVRDLYAESHDDACDHQTLRWTEPPRYKEDPQTLQLVEASPAYPCFEEVRFDQLWDNHSLSNHEA
jgi:hypothetical protein